MTLKQRIGSGEALLGTFVKTPHPHVVEVLATCGLDLLCLDAEHAPFDRGDIDVCVMAARAGNMPVVVRSTNASADALLNALDCGADGILVPHVRSAAEARAVVRAAHYGAGGRGYAGSTRAAGYGQSTMADHRVRSRNETVIIAQIEDVEALDDITAIAAVDGIDALFIGRIDLTVALGANSPDDAVVVDACERIVAAAVAAGRPVGLFLPRADDVPAWRAAGAALFLLGSDHSFIRAGAAQLRTAAGW